MIISNQLVFSNNQAITATAASTDVIDLLAAGIVYGDVAALPHDRMRIKRIPLLFTVTEAFNTLTSLAVAIQTDDNSGFSSATTVFTHSFTLAQLVVGARLPIPVLPDGIREQYMRMNYTVTGTNPTLGKVFAALVPSIQNNP